MSVMAVSFLCVTEELYGHPLGSILTGTCHVTHV